MAWQVRFRPAALKEFQALPRQVQVRIGRRLEALAADPRPPGVKKLAGGEDFYRIRVGDYRVVYAIDDPNLIVLVVKVGHRGDVYRGR